MVIETRSPEETFAVGKSLGEKAFPGQVLTLTGDLGVGKTVFTQGLAEGLGIEEPVNSPTFTIVQVYEEGRLPFYHFDVYRIGDIEEMDEVGFEEYVMGEGVSLIEWANLIEEILPERRTNILIEKDLTQSRNNNDKKLEEWNKEKAVDTENILTAANRGRKQDHESIGDRQLRTDSNGCSR